MIASRSSIAGLRTDTASNFQCDQTQHVCDQTQKLCAQPQKRYNRAQKRLTFQQFGTSSPPPVVTFQ
ncbi:MAG: hypothetical protein FWD31_02380 [Planctomycetaceae bacterium]|nr:hypothetical protein [Planctomycetaceae bacterium]